MATVPTPLDPSPGDKNSASAFDAGVRDVLTFLMTNYPRCHVAAASAVSNASGTATLQTFDTDIYDNDNMHDTVSNTSRIVFQTAGLYEVDAFLTLGNQTYTALNLQVRLNAGGSVGGGTAIRSQGYPVPSGNGPYVFLFRMFRLFSAGDYVEFFITQTSGGAVNSGTTSQGHRVNARWIATS